MVVPRDPKLRMGLDISVDGLKEEERISRGILHRNDVVPDFV